MDYNPEYDFYTEENGLANHYRVQQQQELFRFIDKMREKADKRREKYFNPDYSSLKNYEEDIQKYRRDFMQMLGYPDYIYGDSRSTPEADVTFVAAGMNCKIYRLVIHVSEMLSTYGLLFLPHTEFPCPLVIAQHGGGGTPEKCSGLNGPSAYSNMVGRVLKKGCAVFAPQLASWSKEHGPEVDRIELDGRLKQLGSSIAAVEIYKLMRSLDYLLDRDDIDAEKAGMMGVSLGGFYTLYTAAADTRIKAAITSCHFNSRYAYFGNDKSWPESAGKFLDAEVCALVCPRKLYIEVGMYDSVFDYKMAALEYERAARYYKNAGIPERLVFNIHPHGHIFDLSDAGIDFLMEGLNHPIYLDGE